MAVARYWDFAMDNRQVRIVDPLSAGEAIKRLNEEDLLFMNRLIVERLN